LDNVIDIKREDIKEVPKVEKKVTEMDSKLAEIRAKASEEYASLPQSEKDALQESFRKVTEDQNSETVTKGVQTMNQVFIDIFEDKETKVDIVGMYQMLQKSLTFISASMFSGEKEMNDFLVNVRFDITQKIMPNITKDGDKSFRYIACLATTLLEYLVLTTRLDYYKQNPTKVPTDAKVPTEDIKDGE
jgi:hypothetical protein